MYLCVARNESEEAAWGPGGCSLKEEGRRVCGGDLRTLCGNFRLDFLSVMGALVYVMMPGRASGEMRQRVMDVQTVSQRGFPSDSLSV